MRRNQMSEDEKVIWFMLLFPLFWPFIPVVLICMLCESIGHKYRAWKWGRIAAREARLIR
jgi:hypothetical protein